MKKPLILALVLVLAITPFVKAEPSGNKPTITVGSKKFTENVILGEIVRLLGKQSGVNVRHRKQLGGSRFLWSALNNEEIQLYPEYTGTLLQEILADENLTEFRELRRHLNAGGLKITDSLGFNNTYALAMQASQADERNIRTISDLTEYPHLEFGFTNEFMNRDDGWPGLRRAYNLPQEDVQGLDHDLAYRGLAGGDLDVIDVYTTDAKIEYYDLTLLEDDRNFFPTYNAVYVYDRALESQAPEFLEQLKKLEGKISVSQMTSMNADVQLRDVPAERVAANFLKRELDLSVTVRTETTLGNLLTRTSEHLFMVAISLAAAILLAVPLGIAATYWRPLGRVILGTVGILQTIPSIALLVFMIPLFGIGTTPAMVALFLYSLLPIVQNTYSGLEDIGGDVLESARALGLTELAILTKIKLPLSLRSILAGVKTSAVINVGVATLGALIGAGGYGQPIFTGIRLDDMSLVLQGAIPAALLALAVQWLFDLVEYLLLPQGLDQNPG